MAKIYTVQNSPGEYLFYCPGCLCSHSFHTEQNDKPKWTFNGDLMNPTFSPSLRVQWVKVNDETGDFEKKMLCHLFVRNGKIEFLNDCTHELAGKICEMVEC
ncbi:MAG TPA: DUF6527 family protein [Chitinophagaceae bacterium]|nr:DUF6527 family protein [Chitinophagaceae bacterium]